MIPRNFFRRVLRSMFGLRSSRNPRTNKLRSQSQRANRVRSIPTATETLEDRTLLSVNVLLASPTRVDFNSDIFGGSDDATLRATDGVLEFAINGNDFSRDVDPNTAGVQEFLLTENSQVFADINGILFIGNLDNAAGTFVSLDDLEILAGSQISTRVIPNGGNPATTPSVGDSRNILFQAPDIVVNDNVTIFAGVEAGSAFTGGDVQFISRAAKDLTWDSVIPLFNDVDASASITLGAVTIDAANIVIDADTTTTKFASFQIDEAALTDVVENQLRTSFTGIAEFDTNAAGDTITRSTGNWIIDGFEVGQVLDVTNSLLNDNFPDMNGGIQNPEIYRIASVTASVITLTQGNILHQETATGVIIKEGVPKLTGNPELTIFSTGSPFARIDQIDPDRSFPAEGIEALELLNVIDAVNPLNNGLYRVNISTNEQVELIAVETRPETSGVELTFTQDEDGADVIQRATGDWFLEGYELGMFIEVSGTNSNNTDSGAGGGNAERYQIAAMTESEITLITNGTLLQETSTSATVREVVTDVPIQANGYVFVPADYDIQITRAENSGSFLEEGFQAGQTISVEGSQLDNDGTYTVTAVTDLSLVLSDDDSVNDEINQDIFVLGVLTTLTPEMVPLMAVGRDGLPLPNPASLGVAAEDVIDNLKVSASLLSPFINQALGGIAQGNISDASSHVVIGNGSRFTASGDVLISSHTMADVTLSSAGLSLPFFGALLGGVNIPVGAGFGVSEADATAIVQNNVNITAGGVFNLDSHIQNTLAVTIMATSGQLFQTGIVQSLPQQVRAPTIPVQIPFPSLTLAFGLGDSDSESAIEAGATITASEVFVTAANDNNFITSAGASTVAPRTNFGQGASIAVHVALSESTARVDGTIVQSGDQSVIPNNVTISSRSTNINNDVAATAKVRSKVKPSPLSKITSGLSRESQDQPKSVFGSSDTFLSNNKGTSQFGLGAAVAVAIGTNEAFAGIGDGGQVNAQGDLNINAEAEDNFRGTAFGGANAAARVAISGALLFGKYENEAIAQIGENAIVNVGGALEVISNAVIPNQVQGAEEIAAIIDAFSNLQFDPPLFAAIEAPFNNMVEKYERLGDNQAISDGQDAVNATNTFISSLQAALQANSQYVTGQATDIVTPLASFLSGFLPPKFGGVNKQPTTHTNASANSKTADEKDSSKQKGIISFGGTLNILLTDNTAVASIEQGAMINQDASFFELINPGGFGAGFSVKVEADASLQSLNVGGLATPKSLLSGNFGPKSDTAGVGGNLAAVIYNNTARAYIADRVRVKTEEDVVVDSESDVLSITMGQAGGSAKYGFAGSFTGNGLTLTSEAYIEDSAHIEAGRDVRVTSENDLIAIGLNLVFEKAETVGVGVSAAVNVFDVTTLAYIGNNEGEPATLPGSITAGRDVIVQAENAEISINIALAAAITTGAEKAPSNPANMGTGGNGGNASTNLNNNGVNNASQSTQPGSQTTPTQSKSSLIKAGFKDFGTDLKTAPARLKAAAGTKIADIKAKLPGGGAGGGSKLDAIKGIPDKIQGAFKDGNGNDTTGVSISGDAIINVILEDTRAFIADNTVVTSSTNAAGRVGVFAESDLLTVGSTIAIAGGLSQKGASIAGSLTSDNLIRNTEAFVTNTEVIGHNLEITADSDHNNVAVVAGGAGRPSGSTKSGSVAGSAGLHVIVTNTRAELDTPATMTGNVVVDARNESQILSIAGTVAVDGGIAAGGAPDVVVIINNTEAKIGSNAVVMAGGDVTVAGESQEDILAAAAGLAISGNRVGITGSAALQVIITDVTASIEDGAKVFTDETVIVDANNRVRILSLAGAVAGGSKAGVGAGFSGNFIARDVEAKIGENAEVDALGNGVSISAESEESIMNFGASGAIGQQLAVAANWTPTTIVSSTRAFIDENAKVNTMAGGSASQDVRVHADHDTDIISLAGAVGISIESAGLGVALSNRGMFKTVEAFIAEGAEVGAGRHVEVEAASQERMLSVVASAGIAQGFAGAGAVSGDVIIVDTKAFIDDNATVIAQGNVVVSAVAESQTFALVGQAAASAGSPAVGGSNATLIRVDTTEAWIGENANVTANAQRGTSTVFDGNRSGAFGIGSKGTEEIQGVSVTAVSFDDIVLAAIGGALSNSIAVSGSVSDYVLIETTRAFIDDGANINQDNSNANSLQSVNVLASDKTDSIGLAGGLGGGSTAGIGASADFAALVKDTIAFIGAGANVNAKRDVRVNAQSDEDVISIAANLQFSTGSAAVAGAASSYVVVTTTRAAIEDNATVLADGLVVVDAESDSFFIQAAGQISLSSSVGVGISNNLLIQVDLTEAYIGENANVFAGQGMFVTADSEKESIAVSFGGTGAGSASVAGSLIERALVQDTFAYIGQGAKINENNNGASGNQSVTVTATAESDLNGGAGVISGSSSVGIGAALDFGLVIKTTEAYIDESATVRANRNVIVRSESDETVNSLTGNLSIGGSVAVAGAVNVYGFLTVTTASIRDNATVSADGNVIVNADDNMISRMAQGTLGLSGTVTVGGGTATLAHVDDTLAWIGKNANVTALGTKGASSVSTQIVEDSTLVRGVAVVAESRESSIMLVFAGGLSLSVAVEGAFTDAVFIETTRAYIDEGAKINADLTGADNDQDVHVRAEDTSTITDIAVAITIGVNVAVGGAFDLGNLTKITEAYIADNALVQANDDITVQAETKEFIISEVISEGVGYAATGVSAAIGVWIITTTAEAYIGRATVTAGGNLSVATQTNATIAVGTGNVAGSLVAGVGGSNVTLVHIDTARAYIADGAIITARGNGGPMNVEAARDLVDGLAVTAYSEELFVGITFGFALGIHAAVTGSLSANVLVETTEAYIGKNAQINLANDGAADQDVVVRAEDETKFSGVAGAFALGISGVQGGAGVGGAADAGALTKFTTAEIDDDAIVNATGNVVVEALSEELMVSVAGTAAVSIGIGVGVAGAAGLQLGLTNTNARIGKRTRVRADGSVVVTADDDNTMVLGEGNISAGLASAGASLGVAVVKSNTTAVIDEDAVIDALGYGDGVEVRTGLFDVTFGNFAPIAEPDAFRTDFNTPLNASVTGNDTDADSDPADLTYTLVTQDDDGNSIEPRFGNLELNADGSFTYTPDPGFAGYDTFVYEVTDETGLKDRATVRIGVARSERSPAEDENPDSQANSYQQPPADAVLPTSDNADINDLLSTGGLLDESFTGLRNARPQTRIVHGVVVTSTAETQIVKITASGSASGGAISISGAINVAITDTTATIADGAQINQDDTLTPDEKQSVLVGAGSDYSSFGFVGSAALGFAPMTLAASPALDLNVLVAETEASIGANVDVSAAADVTVQADANQDALSISAGFGASGGVSAAGTLSMLFLDSTTHAHIGENSEAITTVDAGGNVLVSVRDETDSDLLSGSAAISAMAGLGASLAATPILKDTQAYIAQGAIVDAGGNSVGDMDVLDGTLSEGVLGGTTARGVAVQAVSSETLFTIVAAGAFGGPGLAGSVIVEYVDSDTQAYIGENAKINTTASPDNPNQAVNVAAGNALNIFTISGAVNTGGVVGAFDVGILRNDTAAFIGSGSEVNAANDVNVYAIADVDVTSIVASVGVAAASLNGSLSLYAVGGNLESNRSVDNPSGGTLNDNVLQDNSGNTIGGFYDGSLSDLVDQVTGDNGLLAGYTTDDYGDAPDTYSTLLASNGARHRAEGPGLGALRGVELDGTPDSLALGDDLLEVADEDGVTIPVMTIGQTATMTLEVTGLEDGETAFLDGFIDWNGNGSFNDPGEKVFDSVLVTAGINELMVSVPVDARVGQTFSRFRISSAGGLSFDGAAANGEVEDYLVTIAASGNSPFDFGDAPESYGTLLADDGARHMASGPMLGTSRDTEADGLPSADAGADDGVFNELEDNGDGVTLPVLIPGEQITITVVVSADARLDGFIDFDGDGTFNGPGEKVFDNIAVTEGENTLTIDVPVDALLGQTFARFRLSSIGGLSAGGLASDGEVEDYRVTVFDPKALPPRNSDSEQILGMISQQARRDVNDAFSNRVDGRVSNDINRPIGSTMGTNIPRGTSAQIGDDVILVSGRDVNVEAIQSTDINIVAGSAGFSLAGGIGASVGLALIDTPVEARVGESSTLTAEGSIDVIADYRADSDGFGIVGQLGVTGVGLGAQVLVFDDRSDQTAVVSEGANLTRSLDQITVEASAARDFDLQSIGVGTGVAAFGASIAIANISGRTEAKLEDDVQVGTGENDLVSKLTVAAITEDVIATQAIGVAAGIVGAGAGTFVGSTLNINVEGTIGEDVGIETFNRIELTSDSQATVNAEAFGGAAGAFSIGVMLADATVDGRRRTHVGDRTDIRLNGVLAVKTETDNTVTAQTIAAAAGLATGQGNVATARLFPVNGDGSPDVVASLGEDIFSTASVFVESHSRGGAKAESFGVVLGVLAIGVNEANATVSPTVEAVVGRGTVIDGDLRLHATHNQDADGTKLDGKAEAIAGPSGPDAVIQFGIATGNITAGLLSGTGATANAKSLAFVTSRIEDDVEVNSPLETNLVAASFNHANAESRGTTLGVVGVGVIKANALSGGDTQILIGEDVQIDSTNSIQGKVFADHEATALAAASTIGIATGQGAIAQADVGVNSDDKRRNFGSGLTQVESLILVGDGSELSARLDIDLITNADTNADATALGLSVGLISVGVSQAFADVRSNAETRIDGASLDARGSIGPFFNSGGDLTIEANADNTATANGNASGGGLISGNGFEGEAEIRDSETQVTIGPNSSLNALQTLTLKSNGQNTADVDGNAQTFGIIGVGATVANAVVDNVTTAVIVESGTQITGEGNVVILADEKIRVDAVGEAAAGGLITGAGADVVAEADDIRVETLLQDGVTVDIAGDFTMSSTYDPRVVANARGTNDSFLFSAAKVGFSRADASDDSRVHTQIGESGTGSTTLNVGGNLTLLSERVGLKEPVDFGPPIGNIILSKPTVSASATGSLGDDLISLFSKNNSHAEAEIDNRTFVTIGREADVTVGGTLDVDARVLNHASSFASNESDQFAQLFGQNDSYAFTQVGSTVRGEIGESARVDVGQTLDVDVFNEARGNSTANGVGEDISGVAQAEALANSLVEFDTLIFVGDNADIHAVDEISMLADTVATSRAVAEIDGPDASFNAEPDTFANAAISDQFVIRQIDGLKQVAIDDKELFDGIEDAEDDFGISNEDLIRIYELRTAVEIGEGAKLESQRVDLSATISDIDVSADAKTVVGFAADSEVDSDVETFASAYTSVELEAGSEVIGTESVRLSSIVDDLDLRAEAKSDLTTIDLGVNTDTDADSTGVVTSRAEITADSQARVESSDLLVHADILSQFLFFNTDINGPQGLGNDETDRTRIVTNVDIDYNADTLITRAPKTLVVDENGIVTANGVTIDQTTEEIIVTGISGGSQPGEIEFNLGSNSVGSNTDINNTGRRALTGAPTIEFATSTSDVFIENRSDKHLRIQDLDLVDSGGVPIVQFTGNLSQELDNNGFAKFNPLGVNQMIQNLVVPLDIRFTPLVEFELRLQPQFPTETNLVKFVDAGSANSITVHNLTNTEVRLDGFINAGDLGSVDILNTGGDILATQTDQFIRGNRVELTSETGDIGSGAQAVRALLVGNSSDNPTVSADASPEDGDVFLSVVGFSNGAPPFDTTVFIFAESITGGGDVNIALDGVGEFPDAWPVSAFSTPSTFRIDRIEAGGDVDLHAQQANFLVRGSIVAGDQIRASSGNGNFTMLGTNDTLSPFGLFADSAILDFALTQTVDLITTLSSLEAQAGGVEIINTGDLTIGGVSNMVGINAGTVEIINNGSVTIIEDVLASTAGDFEIEVRDTNQMGDDLIVTNNARLRGGGVFSLEAGDTLRLDLGTTVEHGNRSGVFFSVDQGNFDPDEGGTLEVFGLVTGLNLSLFGGTEDDIIRLARVGANTPTSIFGNEGHDDITIGDEINRTGLDEVQSTVNVMPEGGNDQLLIHDGGSDDARNYRVTSDRVEITATQDGVTGIGTIIFNQSENVLLRTAAELDVVNIEGLNAGVNLTVNTGLGNDEVNIANPNGSLDSVQGNVHVIGFQDPDSGDVLTISDIAANAGSTFTLDDNSVQRTGSGTITFETVETLNLNTTDFADRVVIESTGTPDLLTLTINTNAGDDRVEVDGTNLRLPLTIDAGSGSETNGDRLVFDQGLLTLTPIILTTPDGTAKAGNNSTLTYTNFEAAVSTLSTFQFSQTTYAVNEAGTPVGLAVTIGRTGPVEALEFESSVLVNFTGLSATAGLDFLGAPIEVVFDAQETSKVVLLPILQNTIVEARETVILSLVPKDRALTSGNTFAIVTIHDDDQAILSIDNMSHDEGDNGTVEFTFTVTLDNDVQPDILVDFAAVAGTLSASEFAPANGTLQFTGTANEQKTITVLVNGDDTVEAEEMFSVMLSNIRANGANVIANPAFGVGTVRNDDAAVVTIEDAEADEDAETITFTLTLDHAVDVDVAIGFTTMTDSAGGGDFTQTNGTAIISAGDLSTTITVAITNDSIVEADEQFFVNLSNLSADGREVTLPDTQATGTILDTDFATITLTPINATQFEGNGNGTTAFTFEVTLNNDVQGGFNLAFATNDGTATLADGDYVDNDVTLQFSGTAQSQTITVLVNQDGVLEADETFQVALGAITGLNLNIDPASITIINGQQTGTITNDDQFLVVANGAGNPPVVTVIKRKLGTREPDHHGV